MQRREEDGHFAPDTMKAMHDRSFSYTLSLTCILVLIIVAVFQISTVSAQTTQDDLRAAIRAELLSDPRVAALTAGQLDSMVNALTNYATKKGLSAHDVAWSPQPATSFTASAGATSEDSCDQSSFLCRLASAFGFSGTDMTIPIWIGICSAILVLILGAMIEVHRRSSPKIAALRK